MIAALAKKKRQEEIKWNGFGLDEKAFCFLKEEREENANSMQN